MSSRAAIPPDSGRRGRRARRFRLSLSTAWLRREEGQAIVEMALALPLLLLLITAILQFGSMFSAYTAITDAARTGARELALGRGLSDPCDLAVKQTLTSTAGAVKLTSSNVTPSFTASAGSKDYCGLTSTGASCSYSYNSTCNSNGTETEGDEATVKISYPYTITVFGMKVLHITLSTSASDAIE